MTMNRKDEREVRNAVSDGRRQFLHHALRFGGAAALLMTSASREILAQGLTLSQAEMDAARRAQQTPGAPGGAKNQAAAAEPTGMCTACEGSCTGACTGGCTSCTGCSGCTASCASGCSGGCSGGCHGTCEDTSRGGAGV